MNLPQTLTPKKEEEGTLFNLFCDQHYPDTNHKKEKLQTNTVHEIRHKMSVN